MTDHHWQVGDRLVHTARPEWGTGQVTSATAYRHEGEDCQRLTIRFDRAGTKALSTAFADLAPAGAASHSAAPSPASVRQASPTLSRDQLLRKLTDVPEPASDPFRSLQNRLEATTNLYRFEPTGKALLDWAAAQTGLSDPLSVFSRTDLEQAFERFRAVRDTHLRSLVHQARKEEPSALSGLGVKVTPAVRELLTRMLTER